MKNVLLVCGGKSYEHDISVVTASQIFSKTKIDGVNLIFLYISRDNKFYVYTNKKIELKDFSIKNFSPKNKKFKEIVFVSSEKNKLFTRSILGLKEYAHAEVTIMCTHGGDGENGKLVSFFENLGISTTAGNFDSLAVCMNKFLFKQVMKGIKVSVVKGFKLNKSEYENNKKLIDFKLRVLKFPVVIKPVSGGSSIGLFIANNDAEFVEKTSEAFMFDNEILVERYVSGAREFNVAVMGDRGKIQVSEIDEPLKSDEILTFADKYLKNNGSKKLSGTKGSMESQKRTLPANIPSELKERIQLCAKKIFVSLGLCGVARIDFLLDETKQKLYVGEVNAIPGSLAYYFFCKSGFMINGFVEKLINIAEEKITNKVEIKTEFMPSVLE